MQTEIKLTRLQGYEVKGNFTIKCHSGEEFCMLNNFFWTSKAKLKFKDILRLQDEKKNNSIMINGMYTSKILTMGILLGCDRRRKFIIQYENLQELLKLREIFEVRASGYDTKHIEKRKYDPFTPEFFEKLTQPITKIRK